MQMICAPDVTRYDGTPFRLRGRSGIVLPPMERRINPGRFRRLLQRPAITRLARSVLVQLALLQFAPLLRATPLEQPVDASSLPDSPEPQSGTSSPALQAGPGHEHELAGDSSIVSPATAPCSTCRLNWYRRFANRPQRRPLTPSDKGWLAAQLPRPVQPCCSHWRSRHIGCRRQPLRLWSRDARFRPLRRRGRHRRHDRRILRHLPYLLPSPSGPALLPYGACSHPQSHLARSY